LAVEGSRPSSCGNRLVTRDLRIGSNSYDANPVSF